MPVYVKNVLHSYKFLFNFFLNSFWSWTFLYSSVYLHTYSYRQNIDQSFTVVCCLYEHWYYWYQWKSHWSKKEEVVTFLVHYLLWNFDLDIELIYFNFIIFLFSYFITNVTKCSLKKNLLIIVTVRCILK